MTQHLAEPKRRYLHHGLSGHPSYRVWQSLQDRCVNPNHHAFDRYGGRGITICDRWRDAPAAFIADMGTRPSDKHEIDRIDNDGGYSPDNCRWVTCSQNNRNRRSSKWVEFGGARRLLMEVCDEVGVDPALVRSRLLAGWSADNAITIPVRQKADDGTVGPPSYRWHLVRFTESQKRAIHAAYAAGQGSHATLAVRFGGKPSTICNIVRDNRYSGVTGEPERPVFTGANLKQWRTKRGWSQRRTARWMDLDASTMSRAEAKPEDRLGDTLQAAFDRCLDLEDPEHSVPRTA